MDYLRSIENVSFPLHVEDQQAIDCIYVLRAAELVTADISPTFVMGDYKFAVVTGITPKGRAALDYYKQGKPAG